MYLTPLRHCMWWHQLAPDNFLQSAHFVAAQKTNFHIELYELRKLKLQWLLYEIFYSCAFIAL